MEDRILFTLIVGATLFFGWVAWKIMIITHPGLR